jgi:hypothetical protein
VNDHYYLVVLQQYDPVEDIWFDIATPFMGLYDIAHEEARRLAQALNEAMPTQTVRAVKAYTVKKQTRMDVRDVMIAAVAAGV